VAHRLVVRPRAARALRRLPPDILGRITAALHRLEDDPRPTGAVKLKGEVAYRMRVGAYRVVYSVDDTERTVLIASVGHRSDVYR
jgi:mRNA interferase RelE/StbE